MESQKTGIIISNKKLSEASSMVWYSSNFYFIAKDLKGLSRIGMIRTIVDRLALFELDVIKLDFAKIDKNHPFFEIFIKEMEKKKNLGESRTVQIMYGRDQVCKVKIGEDGTITHEFEENAGFKFDLGWPLYIQKAS